MELLTDYLIFLLKVFTIALAVTLPLLIVIGSSKGKSKAKGKLSITNLSDKFEEMGNAVKGSVMNPKELKKFNKENLKDKKKKKKERLMIRTLNLSLYLILKETFKLQK